MGIVSRDHGMHEPQPYIELLTTLSCLAIERSIDNDRGMSMRLLIISDVHLKPWMFDGARQLLREHEADRVICLGDLVDDWGCDGR